MHEPARLSERGDENLDQAGIEAAFSRATEPHPDQAQYQLKGRSNFAFNSYETEHWPDQLTTFLSDQFHVEHDRLRVVRFGAGKSGDLVFGVFLDSKSLGLLKIYRDPQGAGTDAHILHVVDQAHIEHYVPAQDKGGIADVSIDGNRGSSLFTELVPGLPIESMIQHTPPDGAARAAHLEVLERSVKSAAVSFADLHRSMASGREVDRTHKEDEARFIMAKFEQMRAKNDAKGFTSRAVLDQFEHKLRNEIIPAFVNSPLPATAYHGDAHVGNIMVDEQMEGRPIDLTSMKWSLDENNQGIQTGAVDVGQFVARLYEKSEGALTLDEVERLRGAFLDEYFRQSPVSWEDMRAGSALYAVESQFARIAYDIGDPKDAMAAATRLIDLPSQQLHGEQLHKPEAAQFESFVASDAEAEGASAGSLHEPATSPDSHGDSLGELEAIRQRAVESDSRGPNAQGTTPSERLGDLSGWEPLLRSVAKNNYAVDKHGVPMFDGGASSMRPGERPVSIERAQQGLNRINELDGRLKLNLSTSEKAAIKSPIEAEAKDAASVAVGRQRDVSVAAIPQQWRDAARARHATLLDRLEKGEAIALPAKDLGDAETYQLMSELTMATGHEVALLRTDDSNGYWKSLGEPDGQQFLVLGDTSSINLPKDVKVLAHTHPGGDLRLSEEDEAALGARNQTSSVVVGASGKAVRLGASEVDEAHGGIRRTRSKTRCCER